MAHGGQQISKHRLKKKFCPSLDTNTASTQIKLADNNRRMTYVTDVEELQSYPDHAHRFDRCQVLCKDNLTGCHYWEVECRGDVLIAVSYRAISRKGVGDDSLFGGNVNSWSLECLNGRYSVWYDNDKTEISSSSNTTSYYSSSSPSVSYRVAVHVDYRAGSLSFYRVCSDRLFCLHTFKTTFTEPLYPGFGLWTGGSSVSLCSV